MEGVVDSDVDQGLDELVVEMWLPFMLQVVDESAATIGLVLMLVAKLFR